MVGCEWKREASGASEMVAKCRWSVDRLLFEEAAKSIMLANRRVLSRSQGLVSFQALRIHRVEKVRMRSRGSVFVLEWRRQSDHPQRAMLEAGGTFLTRVLLSVPSLLWISIVYMLV